MRIQFLLNGACLIFVEFNKTVKLKKVKNTANHNA